MKKMIMMMMVGTMVITKILLMVTVTIACCSLSSGESHERARLFLAPESLFDQRCHDFNEEIMKITVTITIIITSTTNTLMLI